jgi:putative ABC transport system permease protein
MSDDQIPARWRNEVRRAIPEADDELVEEVAQHVWQRWQSAKAEGLSDDAANDGVRRDLEAWRGTRVPRRERRRTGFGVGWVADARFACRSLRSRPSLTLAVILLTAIGIGATVAAFAVVYGILWRPLPYPDGERLAVLWQVRRGEQGQITYPDFRDLAQASVFDGAAGMNGGHVSLRIADAIHRVNILYLDAPGYGLLGAKPILGRLLREADGVQPNIMISHRLWTRHLSADPGVIGRTLWVSGTTCTVVGVLQEGFDFELPIAPTLELERHDIWRVLESRSPFVARRDAQTYEALVRLAPGATLEEAQGAVDGIAQRLALAYPPTNAERTFRVVPLKAQLVERIERPLLLAAVAALAALGIALANLVTLTLVRLADRRGELAIREALGAGAARLRRQLFTEHLATSIAGAAIGLVLAERLTTMLTASDAANLPRPDAIGFDTPVVLVALCIAGLIAVVLTLLPLRASGPVSWQSAAARGSSRGGRHVRRLLVTSEVAVALALVVGGALLGLSVVRLFEIDPGFRSSGVLSVRVSAFQQRYPALSHVESFIAAVLERIRTMPEVTGVAAGLSLPLSGQMSGVALQAEGRPVPAGSRQQAGWQFITPGYFDTLAMPIVRGRDFTAADRAHARHVTIVNESLARALFGDEDPIGRRLTDGEGTATSDWHEIVGVVGDVRHYALDAEPGPRVYDLFGQHWSRTSYIVVRTRMADAAAALPGIRRVISELDREAPIFEMQTMTSLVERSAASYRLAAILAGALALASIVLALIGVYAVTAASVSERIREIGIRAALGAAPGDLMRMVLREAGATAALAAAIGAAGAFAAARLLQSQLFGVRTEDIGILIPTVGAAVLIVALAAVVPVARRAAHADPLIAMRTE